MNIQIFGVKKCFDTQKAERYFKERKIKYQLIDLNQKTLSKGELNSVKISVGINNLINIQVKEYKTLNLDNIRSADLKEEILLYINYRSFAKLLLTIKPYSRIKVKLA